MDVRRAARTAAATLSRQSRGGYDCLLTSLAQRIAGHDISLFDAIETQLSDDDRRSLLALHAAVRDSYETFAYLEIGSYLGGSLQAVIRDPACSAIVSIDSRPPVQPDERGFVYEYPANSTERMRSALTSLPGADLEKMQTIDASTSELDPTSVAVAPQLCLVDGEHTDAAMLRDARFCLATLAGDACIAFHDTQVVYRGLDEFIRELSLAGVVHRTYFLPRSVFVVEIGASRLAAHSGFREAVLGNADGVLSLLEENGIYRDWFRRSARHRALTLVRAARRAARR